MKRTMMYLPMLCIIMVLSACNKNSDIRFIIGTWKADKSELVPEGTIAPEDQMIINMLNGMLQNVMKDMTIEFHQDGDYLIQFYQQKGLGTYELRANNSVVSFKDDETFGKIYAEIKEKEKGEKELILEFSEELMSDPNWEEMVADLGVPIKFKITLYKETKG